MGMSQSELAANLGVSLKAVQSYEQGWRSIPGSIEKLVFFYLSRLNRKSNPAAVDCWKITKCRAKKRGKCLVERLGAGEECWMVSGNTCNGAWLKSWREKRTVCFKCGVLLRHLRFLKGTPLYTMLLSPD